MEIYTCPSCDGKFSMDVSRAFPAMEHANPSYSAFVFFSLLSTLMASLLHIIYMSHTHDNDMYRWFGYQLIHDVTPGGH